MFRKLASSGGNITAAFSPDEQPGEMQEVSVMKYDLDQVNNLKRRFTLFSLGMYLLHFRLKFDSFVLYWVSVLVVRVSSLSSSSTTPPIYLLGQDEGSPFNDAQ